MRASRKFDLCNRMTLPAAILLFLLTPMMILLQKTLSAYEGATMSSTAIFWPSSTEGWKIAEGPTEYDPNKA